MRVKKSTFFQILLVVMAILTLAGFLKGIFVSLDVDESYAVAQSFRLAQGDSLLSDMWEPHQLSAFLGAIFLNLWLLITGSVEYSVIYLRIVTAPIHIGLGLIFYFQLRKSHNHVFCTFLLFLHLNFLPKWVQSTEFELMHYWFLLGIFLFLNQYFSMKKGNPLLAAGAGLRLLGSMMSYPSMLLLYPFYAAGIFVLERQLHGRTGRGRLVGALFFTGGSGIAGLCFLGYLFSYLSPGEMVECIRNIARDTSHSGLSLEERFQLIYLEEAGIMLQGYLRCFLVAAIICMVFWGVLRVVTHRRSFSWEPVILSPFLLTAVFSCVIQFFGTLFGSQNQFYYQGRFLAIIFPACYLGIRYHRQMARWLYLLVLPGLLSIPAVLVMTNMDVNVSVAKSFLAVLGSMLIYEEYAKTLLRGKEEKTVIQVLQGGLSLFLLGGLLVCKVLLIRITGCGACTVFESLEIMEAGAAKGIYVLQQTAEVWNQNNEELSQYLKEGDSLLYVGAENLIYVRDGISAATPSTQGTTVFDWKFLSWYEENPDRMPTVIVVDKTFDEVPEYNYREENIAVLEWIEENYGDAEMIETEYMIIYRAAG